jgi:peptidoglycan/xylan/chitin deacetylase (PgdA/CDA1 family)
MRLRRLRRLRGRRSTVVSLTFDDGTTDHLLASRVLAEHGLAGTFYVNSGRVGSHGRLAWDDVDELAAAGHEIGGHTVDHVDLTSVPPAEAGEQVARDRQAFLDRGYEARSFAYPYGEWNEAAREVVVGCGFASARRAWGLAGDGDSSQAATESIPPADAYAIRTPPSFETGTTLDDLVAPVLRAEGEGGWLPLVFHGVAEGAAGRGYDIEESVFRPFVAWLAGRLDRLAIRTVGDVVVGG